MEEWKGGRFPAALLLTCHSSGADDGTTVILEAWCGSLLHGIHVRTKNSIAFAMVLKLRSLFIRLNSVDLLHREMRKLTVYATRVFLAERIIPTGIMVRSQVTLDIALRWSADARRNRFLLTSHSAGVKSILRRNTFSKLVIEPNTSVAC